MNIRRFSLVLFLFHKYYYLPVLSLTFFILKCSELRLWIHPQFVKSLRHSYGIASKTHVNLNRI